MASRASVIKLSGKDMMISKRTTIKSPDEYDILSAIWILSCNDEIPEMTYEGIKYRLGLSEDFNAKGLIQSRGEMFRAKVPTRRLEIWKQEMLDNRRLPSWIRDKENDTERKKAIEDLKSEDLFRNQFRADANSPPADLEIIKWGLEHIDRLRKAGIEAREERKKTLSTILVPIMSSVVALAAVITSWWGIERQVNIQERQNRLQEELKHREIESQNRLKYFEVELEPKLNGYTSFIKSITQAAEFTKRRDLKGLNNSLNEAELALYSFEPFFAENLESKLEGDQILGQYREFSRSCRGLVEQGPRSETLAQFQEAFPKIREDFKRQLSHVLFKP